MAYQKTLSNNLLIINTGLSYCLLCSMNREIMSQYFVRILLYVLKIYISFVDVD